MKGMMQMDMRSAEKQVCFNFVVKGPELDETETKRGQLMLVLFPLSGLSKEIILGSLQLVQVKNKAMY